MDVSIGAFEAKAQLSRLLRAVEQGERFTITVRGKPVADLVPHQSESSQGVAAAIASLQASTRIRGVSDADIASFVGEGRL
jgi:prevent-host-death family protein